MNRSKMQSQLCAGPLVEIQKGSSSSTQCWCQPWEHPWSCLAPFPHVRVHILERTSLLWVRKADIMESLSWAFPSNCKPRHYFTYNFLNHSFRLYGRTFQDAWNWEESNRHYLQPILYWNMMDLSSPGVYILSLNFKIAPSHAERALKIFIFAPICAMHVNAIF